MAHGGKHIGERSVLAHDEPRRTHSPSVAFEIFLSTTEIDMHEERWR